MAVFTNRATLSYNGTSVNSNTVSGEISDVLTLSKTAVTGAYSEGSTVTYVISLVNSGTVAFENLTLTDDLGEYQFNGQSLYPLSYAENSVLYYVNGAVAASPEVTAGPPLVISGISVPAGGNTAVVYQADVNEYAPLASGSEITNNVTASGGGLSNPISASETINLQESLRLDITKALSPTVVQENGELTYTFTIRNYGTVAAVSTDNLSVSDTFDPVINPITVSFNGNLWASPANYSYDTDTGVFTTVPGQILVPAATVTQNQDGSWTVVPGTASLTVSGTV